MRLQIKSTANDLTRRNSQLLLENCVESLQINQKAVWLREEKKLHWLNPYAGFIKWGNYVCFTVILGRMLQDARGGETDEERQCWWSRFLFHAGLDCFISSIRGHSGGPADKLNRCWSAESQTQHV